jgi:hypothetical protein
MILVTPRLVALNARKDHVIYAGRGALEGAGSFGFTQQERRSAPEIPAPAANQEAPAQPPTQQERPLPSPGSQPANPPPATNPPPANPLEGNPQQANPQQPAQPQ